MANDTLFREPDYEETKNFLEGQMIGFTGKRVLDLCGGIGRNGDLLMHYFDTIDIIDLEPDFGSIPKEKQGTLFRANLKDIRQHIFDTQYDCLFGSWALCYIKHEDIIDVLSYLYEILKPDGQILLKEPIIEDSETKPRLTEEGQYMMVRPQP